jgi:hypothetical protein
MTGKIYLLQENGSLQAMSERSYVTEERLQALLGDYPDLLAGDQVKRSSDTRIRREVVGQMLDYALVRFSRF